VSDQGLTSGTTIQLYNSAGQLLISNKLSSSENSVQIPVAAYARGMYFVRIANEVQETTSKVIKH
jgi:hypothetical protein